MNYADIIYYDTGNSHGISTTLFVSGCDMSCPKCHNPQAQDYNFGRPFTEKEEKEILESLKNPYIDYLVPSEPLLMSFRLSLLHLPILRYIFFYSPLLQAIISKI